jgi:hypothetical protein
MLTILSLFIPMDKNTRLIVTTVGLILDAAIIENLFFKQIKQY